MVYVDKICASADKMSMHVYINVYLKAEAVVNARSQRVTKVV